MTKFYRCPGCSKAIERANNWQGVFCSDDCKRGSSLVRATRGEIDMGEMTAPTVLMHDLWFNILMAGENPLNYLPGDSGDMWERGFFPEPMHPADHGNWRWRSYKATRKVGSSPEEVTGIAELLTASK